jgi:hypothetical protein
LLQDPAHDSQQACTSHPHTMGLCASAPVSDGEGSSGRRGRSSLEEPGGGGGDAGAAGGKQHTEGRRRSDAAAERLKPVLGHFDDVKQHYAFDRVLG